MSYVFSLLWFPILLSLALGVLVGMTSYGRQPRTDTSWLFGAAIVIAFLFVLAIGEMVPGRTGLWLEGTVLMLMAYLVGCVAGAMWKALQPQPVAALAAAGGGATHAFKAPEPVRPAPAPRAAEPAPAPAAPAPAAPSAPAAAEADTGDKPAGIAGPRNGKADDLKRVRGIGRQNEERLHGLGIWHFDQIAGWTEREVRWVGNYLAFPGRIEREDWVGQAKVLATGGETEFSKRVDRGEVETSQDGPKLH